MKRMRICKKHSNFNGVRREHVALPNSIVIMSAGYLLGCLIGALVAIKADTSWLTNLFSHPVDSSSVSFFSVFCGYCAYGFLMLLFATSYLGFFFIPGILTLKGVLSACVFTAMMRGAADYQLFHALAELLIPGVFVLSALLILGRFCMLRSVRLYRIRSGESLPPDFAVSSPIAAALVLFLMASAMKIYALPFLPASL